MAALWLWEYSCEGVINYVTGPTRIFPHDRYKPLRSKRVDGGFILIIISYYYSNALKTSVVRNVRREYDIRGKRIFYTGKNDGQNEGGSMCA